MKSTQPGLPATEFEKSLLAAGRSAGPEPDELEDAWDSIVASAAMTASITAITATPSTLASTGSSGGSASGSVAAGAGASNTGGAPGRPPATNAAMGSGAPASASIGVSLAKVLGAVVLLAAAVAGIHTVSDAEPPHGAPSPLPVGPTATPLAQNTQTMSGTPLERATEPVASTPPLPPPSTLHAAAPMRRPTPSPSSVGTPQATPSAWQPHAGESAPVASPWQPETPVAPPASLLAEENDAVRRARAALRAGDAPQALRILTDAERRFGAGAASHAQLEQEREALAIEALARSGDRASASARGAAFLRAYPGSPHSHAVSAFLVR